MGTQGGTGRRRSTKKERSTAEDDALNLIAREAEARLAAKRAARAEAREIRMKELERQQKEIFQVQKKYYGLDARLDERSDSKWGDIEQWMEDSERYSHPSRVQTLSDEDERMSVGSRGSVRSDFDSIGAHGGGDSTAHLHKKSKKKKKHKHRDRDRNGYDDDDYSVVSSRSSRLSDESRVSRSSRLDLTSSGLGDDSGRPSRASRLDLQLASYASSDLYGSKALSSCRTAGSAFNGYQSSLYDDGVCAGSRRGLGSASHPLDYTSYRSSSSRASSRASSARASPVDNCGSVASFLRSAASSSGLPRDLDDVTIPDFPDVEDRDYLEKGSRAASSLTAGTLTSLGGTSSRRGSGETALTLDAETSLREIKDALAEVEEKYRKAMVSNAQLDNEKGTLMYQVDTLKDSLMELEEMLSESQRGHDDKVKELEREKHAHGVLQFQFSELKETLKQSEELLNEIRQLRNKQEGFVREISDLQETVEWKDKKIGALERQKEYTDAIRVERDELREEVVKLKDVLKKHGILLGPDLNINGDVAVGVDDSSGADPVSQTTADTPTSPPEGNNSMLGGTEAAQLKSRGKEELTLEQPREMRLSSDSVAAADALETPRDEVPNGEPQTCFAGEADSVEESGPTNDRNDDVTCEHAITAAVDIDCCEPQIPECVISCEKNALESDSGETENHSSSIDALTNDEGELHHVSAELHSNQQSFENSNSRSEEPALQLQDNSQEFPKSLPNDSASEMANTELQQEPENDEEVEVEVETNEVEAVSTESQSQVTPSSGKKKRKKRKGKKKGKANEDTEKDKNEDETAEQYERVSHLTAADDVPAMEVLVESRTDEVDGKMSPQQSEPGDPEGGVKSTEPAVQSETAADPKPDYATSEHGEEQTSETAIVVEEESVKVTESLSHDEMPEEVHTEHGTDGRDEDKGAESEKIDEVEVAETAETFTLSETLKEPTTVQVTEEGDEEVNSETDTLAAAAAEVGEPERTADTVSHTVAPQDIPAERSVVLEVRSSGTGGAEEAAGTTGNHSGDEASEESGLGHPDEEQSLETDSSEPGTSFIPAPPDDPGSCNPNIDNAREVRDDTSSPDNPGDQTDVLMTNGSAVSRTLSNETEPGSGEAKLEENLEDGTQAASAEVPPAPETGGDDKSPSESSTEDPSGSWAPLETLTAMQPDANADVAVSVGQDGDELEREAVAGKEGADDGDESLAAPSTANADVSDHVTSPDLVAETDDAMSRTREVNDDDVESAAVVPPDSEGTRMADMSGAPGGSAEAGAFAERQSEEAEDEEPGNRQRVESTDGTPEDLSPNPQVSEVDDEDDEGQSFDFDDLDVEAAVAAKCRLEDNEEGGQAQSDKCGDRDSVLDESDSESNENAQPEVVGSRGEEAVDPSGQTDSQQTAAAPAGDENVSGNPQKEAPAADEQPAVDEGGPSTGGEPDRNPTKILAVEEGVGAAKHHELQDERAAGEKEPQQQQQQARKDSKKNSKKGKTKGKEDCKMS
ncbi:uncharacterized protein lrrfip1a isoform X4 [Nelusetta ayraudi]|uniref:uncharacterized protein lrrfip1a isoform X4 n=1 Tax=Nelusetta ayraudi TaxID=303726 RepID=UPI003F72D265